MNRALSRILVAVALMGAGILVGWQLRGTRSERQAQQMRLGAELDRIATHAFNLQLICANREQKAKSLSEQRLFEAVHRAAQLVQTQPQINLGIAAPNLTEAIGRAALYARSNAAPTETVEEAERLHAWLREQLFRHAT